jgi:uroporphyrinogen decarboxylase
MTILTSRRRVETALAHQEPDRVPWDCTFTVDAYSNLMQYLGLPITEAPRPNWASAISIPLELLHELQTDLCYVGLSSPPSAPVFEYGRQTNIDEWGITYKKVIQPSGRFEYFFDHQPLAEATVKDLDDFPWPDPYDPSRIAGLEMRCKYLFENTEFALVGRFNTPVFEQAHYLRGFQQLLVDCATDPEFAGALLDRTTDIAIGMVQAGLQACGKYLTILRLAGDDMGQQDRTLLAPSMFRQLVKPRFARLYETAKTEYLRHNPNGRIKAHTDGNVYPLLDDYVEMGLDILNPVQPYVAQMDHWRIKQEYGDRLAFHGGIDIQRVLPFGTPEEVRAEAKKVMQTLGRGGGYILAPTHYVLPDVPPANIVALRDAVLKSGQYPL